VILTALVFPASTLGVLGPYAACKKRVVIQNKMSLIQKIFWNLQEHYNNLQFMQIGTY
jgi:hypothetical protein